MKRIITASTLAVMFVLPASALASAPTRAHLAQYRSAYSAARHQFGPRAVGCNLVGRLGSCHIRTTDKAVVTSLGVLDRMLAPQPVIHSSTAGLTTTQSNTLSTVNTVSSSSGGGCGGITPYSGGGQCWAIPYGIVQCESGGQNVPNSSGSGANGYYQLMSGGGGSRAQQDAAASALWNGGKGASNWVCKG